MAGTNAGLIGTSEPIIKQNGEGEPLEASIARATLFARYNPWQPKQEVWDYEGYPPDRRLLYPVSISQASMTIAEALAEAMQQTGVDLCAIETRLRDQKITLHAQALPLQALMVQLGDLLGLFWYHRTDNGIREYVVTYGSSPPSAIGERALSEQRTEWQERRAARIADIMAAADMTDDELRTLGKSDPSLAGAMLKDIKNRFAANALAGLPPAALRELVDTGKVTCDSDQLPDWFADGLRANYRDGEYDHLGVESNDMLVARGSLRFTSKEHVYGPEDEWSYDIWGPIWEGFLCSFVLEPIVESPEAPEPVVFSTFPFLPGNPRVGAGGWLPGRMEDSERARQLFPEVSETKQRTDFAEVSWDLVRQGEKQRLAELRDSPWRDDEQLSQLPVFSVGPQLRVSDMLGAVADQTGYSVLGTYYDQQDVQLMHEVSATEPMYVLLNRVAETTSCSWALVGNIIRWRNDDWFILETLDARKHGNASPRTTNNPSAH